MRRFKPGAVLKEMFASLDWLPTFVEIAGGAKGNDLKAQIEKGVYPGAGCGPSKSIDYLK